jgi:alpha-L-fucosidase 2
LTYNNAGTPVSTRNYNTMGSFSITQTLPNTNTSNYERWLDIEESVGGVQFTSDGITFQREVIASYPDDVIAVHLTASEPGSINFRTRLDRGAWDVIALNRHVGYSEPANGDSAIIGGSTEDDNPIKWAAGVRVVAKGGKVWTTGDNARCQGADEAIVYFQAWTNYRKKDPKKAVLADLKAKGNDFKKLRADHVADYQKYFKRMSISLGESTDEQKAKTTPQRMTSVDTGSFDPDLTELIFQLGRYMLISSSRSGDKSLPPTLQGVWNDVQDP